MAATTRRRDADTDTTPPRTGPGERDVVVGFLSQLREAVVAKAEGVSDTDVRAPGVASGTSLLGLVQHLTAVERFWLLGEDVADWDATWRTRDDESVDDVVAAYRAATTEADAVIATWDDLTVPGPRPSRRGPAPSRRWTLVHMIEETGRHAGHADILRERIDGATGR